eukprot:SAG11_NODE_35245_length_267_cov_1.220238_1_plen_23_part_10
MACLLCFTDDKDKIDRSKIKPGS